VFFLCHNVKGHYIPHALCELRNCNKKHLINGHRCDEFPKKRTDERAINGLKVDDNGFWLRQSQTTKKHFVKLK
jgi:hypothetical protein